MPGSEIIQVAFVVHSVARLGIVLLVLGFGLLARRQLGMSAPLWIAAAVALQWALGLLQSAWNTELVDRFLTDTPPIPTSVGTAITVVALGSDFLYSSGLLLLFAVAMAELIECTRSRVDWGSGRFLSGLVLLFHLRTQLCVVGLALAGIGSLGPRIAAFILSV